jgi:hypothetical protein
MRPPRKIQPVATRESARTADTKLETGRQLNTQYAWAAKDGSVCIRFHVGVIRGLAKQYDEARADREMQPYGVILGSVEQGLTRVVVVEAFEPARHDETMQIVCNRWLPSSERRIHAVGCYRLAMPDSLELTAARWFADVSYPSIDVVIEGPVPDGLAASVSWRPGAGALSQRDRIVFPESLAFSADSLTGQRAASIQLSEEDRDPHGDNGQTRDRARSRRNLGLTIGVVLLGIVILAIPAAIAVKVYETQQVPAFTELSARKEKDASIFGLSVQRQGGSFIVKWDPEAAAIANRNGGILTIRVRDNRRDWILDRDQLMAGKVFYAADADDISFRLEVFDDLGKSRVETLHVLSSPRDEGVSAQIVSPPPVPVPQREEEVAPARRDLKPFAAPPARPVKSAPPPSLPAADLFVDSLFAPVAAAVQLPSVQFFPPRPLEVSRSSAVEPAPNSNKVLDPLAAVLNPPPPVTKPSTVTPVIPVTRVTPTLPVNVRSMIHEPVDVPVSVTVDASGKVIEAVCAWEMSNSSGTRNEFIKTAAVNAALKWRFDPARVDGRAVQGTCLIHFRFAPPRVP